MHGIFNRRSALSVLLSFLPCVLGGAAPRAAGGASGPQFSLIDQFGQPLTPERLKGKPTLLQFGFTHCPVICPTTLYEMARLLDELGPASTQINVVFVSADPIRDTPDVLKRYVEAFDNRIIAATGAEAEVTALAGALGTSIRKTAQGNSYTVDHSIISYLLDRNWVQRGTLYVGPDSVRPRVLESLRRLIDGTYAG